MNLKLRNNQDLGKILTMKIGLKIINIYILYIFMTQISKKKMRKNYKSNKNKSKKRGTFLKGGSRHTNAQLTLNNPPSPRWRPNWSTVVNVVGLQLYGTSLPIWTQADMQNTFKFFLFRKDINRVISLHACGTPQGAAIHAQDCRPVANPNSNLENTTFAATKAMSSSTNVDPDVQFIDLFIQDFTPGSLAVWQQLSSYRFDKVENKTLIHCLAGFGRTGSVLLFNIINYKLNIFDILLNRFFNRADSEAMYNYIRTLIQQNIVIDNNPAENNPWNGTIGAFSPNRILNEVTDIRDVAHANMLITRINYCILFFAQQHCLVPGTPMWLYRKFNVGDVPTVYNVFRPEAGYYQPTLFSVAQLGALYIIP
jgi:hypothetical protein